MVASETSPVLTRAANFSLQAGLTYKRFGISVRHFSNGNTHMPNYGQNLLLLSCQF